jgi:hypothetical protein
LLTARQNLAQLGIESIAQRILQLVIEHNPLLSNQFSDISVVSRYTSNGIQNEILATLADMVREQPS